MEEWETTTGLAREEFEKLTLYIHSSNNEIDNLNRGRILGFTNNVHVAPGAQIRLRGEGRIGDNSFIGLFSYVNGVVVIGERVALGPHCSLTTHTHVYDPSTDRFSGHRMEKIVINDHSWLAAGVIVTAGVTVGHGNLICANAVVTKDTPDYAIMAGTPATQIGRIDPKTGEYIWFKRRSQQPGAETRAQPASPGSSSEPTERSA
jgi:acetyltransferase-like isoleucine patch superfamily enzyme